MNPTDPSTDAAGDDVRRMLDEHAVTRLAARFYDAAMRRDVATFRSLFTEDGVWEITRRPRPRQPELGVVSHGLRAAGDRPGGAAPR